MTLGRVHFNPFTLRLQLDRLHIGGRDGQAAFVDVDEAVINASWTSLFRMAPVLDALRLDHPQIHLARSADGRFNVSDLIDRYAAKPGAPPSPPARFALANIQVHNGDLRFDDQPTRASHRVDQLEVGIPFLANLPSDTDIYVQPLLAMRVDGSPLRIDGQTKPFADSRESTMHFQFDRLDLPRYLAYVPPAALPVAIPKGRLSGVLDLHFVQSQPTSQLQLTGHLQLDDFALATRQGAPILDLGQGGAQLLDLCYEEDSQADVDMNVVMTADGGLIETQATAEKGSYSRAQLNQLIDLAELGLKEIFAAQQAVLASAG